MTKISAQATRTLHVIDLENLARGETSARELLDAVRRYCSVARVAPHDIVEVGMDAGAWRRVAFVLPRNWRVRFGYGPDGADRALLAAVDPASAARCFDRIVIGSGDQAFASLARQLTTAGRRVEVVCQRGALSHRLAREVAVAWTLPGPKTVPPQPPRPVAVAA